MEYSKVVQNMQVWNIQLFTSVEFQITRLWNISRLHLHICGIFHCEIGIQIPQLHYGTRLTLWQKQSLCIFGHKIYQCRADKG